MPFFALNSKVDDSLQDINVEEREGSPVRLFYFGQPVPHGEFHFHKPVLVAKDFACYGPDNTETISLDIGDIVVVGEINIREHIFGSK